LNVSSNTSCIGIAAPARVEQDAVMLTVENLRHAYSPERIAIAGLSFSVSAGEVVAIVGPSGCGKTTLLKAIAGLINPTAGTIKLQETIISGVPEGLAMVFQEYSRSLMPWLTVRANAALPLYYKPIDRVERESRVNKSLEAVGLSAAREQYPWQLSGGMQQRVAIARALAYEPKVLLMDEPFASVDAQTRADLEDLVAGVQQEFSMTILMVTHDIDEAVYLADRVVVLSASPSRILATIPVAIPRPRDQVSTRASEQFVSLRSEVAKLIRRPSADR
jgi:NitT/TauT family transport system ATP-binding protein